MCLTGVFVCDVTGRSCVDGPTNYLLKLLIDFSPPELKHSKQLNPQIPPILMPREVNNVESSPSDSSSFANRLNFKRGPLDSMENVVMNNFSKYPYLGKKLAR